MHQLDDALYVAAVRGDLAAHVNESEAQRAEPSLDHFGVLGL